LGRNGASSDFARPARHDKMLELVERMLDLRELDTRRGRS
jgi:hypothetical protein